MAVPRRRWMVLLALIAAVGLGSTFWRGVDGQESTPAASPEDLAQAESLSRVFRVAAKQVVPTVVKITSTTKPQDIVPDGIVPRPIVPDGEDGSANPYEQAPFGENPFEGTPFEDFFGEEFRGFRFQIPPDRTPPQRGLGSGVIIDAEGVILTNNHVIDGADEVVVELGDGRRFPVAAEDIKTDEESDLAVLRIDAGDPLPAAVLGNSDSVEIGDWVLAVGNPFELEHTVSAGIVSGKGRSLRLGKRTEFFQTDAMINPGNSGGPLVNLRGEVIGINTAIASNNGSYQGVGFAIPVNLAKWVTEQLTTTGRVQRAYLGVGIMETGSELGRMLGVDNLDGVLVGSVLRDSPAAEAGLQVGDVIQSYAGRDVHTSRELQEIVERSPVESRQKVTIIRDGRAKALQVVVEALPEDADLASASSPQGGEEDTATAISRELGLEVGELTDEAARELGLEEGSAGVLITNVDRQGLARMAGISRGMVILEVGRKAVDSPEQFMAALKGQSLEDGVLLKIRTDRGDQLFLLQSS